MRTFCRAVKAEQEGDVIPAQDIAEDGIELVKNDSGTAMTRMTVGLTLRRTTRRNQWLEGMSAQIPPGYLPCTSPDPQVSGDFRLGMSVQRSPLTCATGGRILRALLDFLANIHNSVVLPIKLRQSSFTESSHELKNSG